ncbi:hypothetical protein Ahae2126ch_05430 [Acinetobacter haemolyticus]|nr:hypothetical protein Ahae2126ch_05430 [Acinetobacter haemolyticus]
MQHNAGFFAKKIIKKAFVMKKKKYINVISYAESLINNKFLFQCFSCYNFLKSKSYLILNFDSHKLKKVLRSCNAIKMDT